MIRPARIIAVVEKEEETCWGKSEECVEGGNGFLFFFVSFLLKMWEVGGRITALGVESGLG